MEESDSLGAGLFCFLAIGRRWLAMSFDHDPSFVDVIHFHLLIRSLGIENWELGIWDRGADGGTTSPV